MAKGILFGSGGGASLDTTGSSKQFVFINSANDAEATTETVGGATQPIYMNEGIMTGLSATVGDAKTPLYLSNGKLTAISDSVGAINQPVYLNNGELTAIVDTLINKSAGIEKTLTAGVTSDTFIRVNSLNTNTPIIQNTYSENEAATAANIDFSVYRKSTHSFNPTITVTQHYGDTAPQITLMDTSGYSKFNKCFGAVWNDYAEYWRGTGYPGETVCLREDGVLIKSEKRLQKGGMIISDTYGYILGDDNGAEVPVALSGKVLAYTDKPVKVGDIVCTGKDGTVSKMSRLEIILFPDRIIGQVCEIPTYQFWNGIDVNDRVWIRVK